MFIMIHCLLDFCYFSASTNFV